MAAGLHLTCVKHALFQWVAESGMGAKIAPRLARAIQRRTASRVAAKAARIGRSNETILYGNCGFGTFGLRCEKQRRWGTTRPWQRIFPTMRRMRFQMPLACPPATARPATTAAAACAKANPATMVTRAPPAKSARRAAAAAGNSRHATIQIRGRRIAAQNPPGFAAPESAATAADRFG